MDSGSSSRGPQYPGYTSHDRGYSTSRMTSAPSQEGRPQSQYWNDRQYEATSSSHAHTPETPGYPLPLPGGYGGGVGGIASTSTPPPHSQHRALDSQSRSNRLPNYRGPNPNSQSDPSISEHNRVYSALETVPDIYGMNTPIPFHIDTAFSEPSATTRAWATVQQPFEHQHIHAQRARGSFRDAGPGGAGARESEEDTHPSKRWKGKGVDSPHLAGQNAGNWKDFSAGPPVHPEVIPGSELEKDIMLLDSYLAEMTELLRPYSATPSNPYPPRPPLQVQNRLPYLSQLIHQTLAKVGPHVQHTLGLQGDPMQRQRAIHRIGDEMEAELSSKRRKISTGEDDRYSSYNHGGNSRLQDRDQGYPQGSHPPPSASPHSRPDLGTSLSAAIREDQSQYADHLLHKRQNGQSRFPENEFGTNTAYMSDNHNNHHDPPWATQPEANAHESPSMQGPSRSSTMTLDNFEPSLAQFALEPNPTNKVSNGNGNSAPQPEYPGNSYFPQPNDVHKTLPHYMVLQGMDDGTVSSTKLEPQGGPSTGACHGCGTDVSAEWRYGPDGPRTLCDDCGLHYAKLVRRRALGDNSASTTTAGGSVYSSPGQLLSSPRTL